MFVVGTPIGNLDDLSQRAVDTLRGCRLIACEDTRVTRTLLQRRSLATPVLSCHKFNERQRIARILDVLESGGDVALVSDGGTPAVSDPGAAVVRAARAAGLKVSPIPGPSAATALWSVSGFPGGPFTVVGFLPHRRGERCRALAALARESRPLLFFESPYRVLDMLADAQEVLGDRECCLGREMTKIHEEFLAGPLSVVRGALAGRVVRGEVALLVAGRGAIGAEAEPGAPSAPAPDASSAAGIAGAVALAGAAAEVRRLMAQGEDKSSALRRVARASGLPRRSIYGQMVRDSEKHRAARADEEE